MKNLITDCTVYAVVALAFCYPAVADSILSGPGDAALFSIPNLGPGQTYPIVLPNIDTSGLYNSDNWPTWHWLIHGTDSSTGIWHGIRVDSFHVNPGTEDKLWMRTVELGLSGTLPTGDYRSDVKSSHVINSGFPGANPYDLRMDLYHATADGTWNVTPYYRLSGGSWQAFNTGDYTGTGWPGGGPWTTTSGFNFGTFGTGVKVTIDKNTEGTMTFGDPYIALIPAPGALMLGIIGISLVGWLKRRGTL